MNLFSILSRTLLACRLRIDYHVGPYGVSTVGNINWPKLVGTNKAN